MNFHSFCNSHFTISVYLNVSFLLCITKASSTATLLTPIRHGIRKSGVFPVFGASLTDVSAEGTVVPVPAVEPAVCDTADVDVVDE